MNSDNNKISKVLNDSRCKLIIIKKNEKEKSVRQMRVPEWISIVQTSSFWQNAQAEPSSCSVCLCHFFVWNAISCTFWILTTRIDRIGNKMLTWCYWHTLIALRTKIDTWFAFLIDFPCIFFIHFDIIILNNETPATSFSLIVFVSMCNSFFCCVRRNEIIILTIKLYSPWRQIKIIRCTQIGINLFFNNNYEYGIHLYDCFVEIQG